MNGFSYDKLETFFSNFSFICLFFGMLAYWIALSGTFGSTGKNVVNFKNLKQFNFFSTTFKIEKAFVQFNKQKDPQIFQTENETTLPSSVLESSDMLTLSNREPLGFSNVMLSVSPYNIASFAVCLANLSLFSLLILRWFDSGHFPLSNLYESLMFLTWSLTFFHLVLAQTTPEAMVWLGSITSPTAFLTNAFANFSLPIEMQRASALVPALKSNWLMMHVTIMILSYGALLFGSLLSIGFLILTFSLSSKEYEQQLEQEIQSISVIKDSSLIVHKEVLKPVSKIIWAQNLDNLSYRMLGIGFPLLTIGILSGAVWANEAWGSYWSWDPKETWALLTWFVFAIYLHTRITKNWQGKKPAIIASLGFIMVWVCYLGVNLLGEGLHSYGWLKT